MKDLVFQILILIIMAAFYFCYFYKMFRQKQKGIKTDQMGKNKVGFIKFIEVTLKLVTILTPFAELTSIVLNTSSLPSFARIIGIFTALAGTIIFIVSVITMKDSWRAGVNKTEKTELIKEGIYSYSRNPAFLGFDLLYIGILLAFFNPVLLVISLVSMLMFHLQIVNVEEDFLLEVFGDEYLSYRKHVNRYLGRK